MYCMRQGFLLFLFNLLALILSGMFYVLLTNLSSVNACCHDHRRLSRLKFSARLFFCSA
uniref:Uncharacterized protein n=1 Tax=Anguilla anguilla TaxID=7936 RepID=A0A0E9SRJ9_ANGAN